MGEPTFAAGYETASVGTAGAAHQVQPRRRKRNTAAGAECEATLVRSA
jgi:hypothetical protein